MKKNITFSQLLLIVYLICGILACSKKGAIANTNDPFYLKGKKHADRAELSGKPDEYKKAVTFYQKSWRVRQNYSALLQLALIQEKLNDTSEAIHYYKQYIKFAGKDDPNYTYAKEALSDLEKKYYQQLAQTHHIAPQPASATTTTPVAKKSAFGKVTLREKKLIKQNTIKSIELMRLRAKLKKQESTRHNPPQPVASSKPKIINTHTAGTTTYYTVTTGDNLYKISQKNYKSTRYWRNILEANKKTLPDASRLKVGQKLVIPIIK